MESVSSFTAFSGWGLVADRPHRDRVRPRSPPAEPQRLRWLAWLGCGGGVARRRRAVDRPKTRTAGQPLISGTASKFALALAPPVLSGALLTGALERAALMPAAGAVAPALRHRARTGGRLLGEGRAGHRRHSWSSAPWLCCLRRRGAWLLIAGFGGLHVTFGAARREEARWLIRVRHGGSAGRVERHGSPARARPAAGRPRARPGPAVARPTSSTIGSGSAS